MEDNFGMGYAMGVDSGKGNGGFGNGWDSWIPLILFALIFGWGNGGTGGFGGGGGFQHSLDTSTIIGKLDGITNGLSDGFYATNTALNTGFSGVNNAICSLGYQNADLINGVNINMLQGFNGLQGQIANCCCETQRLIERGFADTGYRMATDTCAIQTSIANSTRDIVDNQNSNTRAILDYLCASEKQALRDEVQALRLSASQAAQNNYLVNQLRPAPIPAFNVPVPYHYGFGGNYGGCGCA